MKRKPKSDAKGGGASPEPSCPFCGRRKAVRRLGGRRFYCDHCQHMFQVE